MLLGSQHEDGEDELGGKEHLDEEATHNGGAAAKGSLDVEWPWKETSNYARGGHGAEDLGYEDEAGTCPGDGANEGHADRDCWVEQAFAARQCLSAFMEMLCFTHLR